MTATVFKIYSKTDCPWCQKAFALLDDYGYPTEVVKLDDMQERNDFYDTLGLTVKLRTMPQVFVHYAHHSEYIGGYKDLETWIENNAKDNS